MANLPIKLVKNLYYKKELSTIEIAKRLKVTPWIVQKFMIKNNLPRRTFEEANAIVFKRKKTTFLIKQKLSSREKELKIAGIMLYWTEGAKFNPLTRATVVDFVNSNPQMIRLFLTFLRKICGIDEKRLRVLLYCYVNQDIEFLKKYWYKVTEIPLKQFTKPYIRRDFLLEKIGKMKYGLVHIRYCDKKLLIRIEDWIDKYLNKNNIRVGTQVVNEVCL